MKKCIAFFVGLVAVFSLWFFLSIRPVDALSTKRMLTKIEAGESVAEIATDLEEAGLIRSTLAFKIVARVSGAASSLKAGAFLLSPSQSVSKILTVLRTGKSEQISVTIPEGYTVSDIDTLLASKGLGQSGAILDCAFHCDFSSFDFLPSPTPSSAKATAGRPSPSPEGGGGALTHRYGSRLEGYLFPETYYIDVADYQPKFFLERLLGTFRKRIVTSYSDEAKKKGTSLRDLVTMASLLEEESRAAEERPIVSGILWKRLRSNVALGVDASLRYELGKVSDALTRTDLESVSSYNTRHHRGLPPSPIANAGESAFQAALRPEKSDYWYYLHGSDGRIHYAVTNDEHNANRAKYLR